MPTWWFRLGSATSILIHERFPIILEETGHK